MSLKYLNLLFWACFTAGLLMNSANRILLETVFLLPLSLESMCRMMCALCSSDKMRRAVSSALVPNPRLKLLACLSLVLDLLLLMQL